MDPFQVRLRFVSALHRVNASLPTIQKALSFIVEYGPHMHSELWECILDECKSGSINRRMNLLFLIDAIFTDETLSPTIRALFRHYLERDVYLVFDLAVPEARWDALLNLPAASKIVAAWKARFVLDRSVLDDVQTMLDVRKAGLYALSPERRNLTLLAPSEMQRRIEEDRERHKRLRERAWILPPTAFSHQSLFGTRPEQLNPSYLTRKLPPEEEGDADGDRIWSTQDLNFSQMWDETSDFNDDDVEAILEDQKLSWVNQPPPPPPPPAQTLNPPATATTTAASAPGPAPMTDNPPPRAPASMRLAQQRTS